MGRPTLYTSELGERICDLVMRHPMSVDKICAKYADIPSPETIYKWRHKYVDFAEKYYVAKELQADVAADYMWDRVQEVDERPEAIAKAGLELKFVQWQNARLAPRWTDKKEAKQEINVHVHEQDLKQLK